MYSRKWSIEKEAIFQEHVGKMSDLKLAKMLHVCVKWLAAKRRHLGVPPYVKSKYLPQHHEFIKANYKTKSTRELVAELSKAFPGFEFTVSGVKYVLQANEWFRNYEDFENIRLHELESGRHAEVVKRRNDAIRKHQPGDVFWSNSLNEFVVYMRKSLVKPLRIFLWEQHHGPLPPTHYISLIDKDKPITIDNLRMVQKIGIELATAAKEMHDSWVLSTIRNKSKEVLQVYKDNPILIEAQRKQLKAKRKIKALQNANIKLAQASKKDA